MPITADSPIQVSLGKALAGAVALAGLILGGSCFIMSQVKDDVADLRSDMAEQRQVSREDGKAREDSDAALRQSLADLTAQLQVTTAELSNVTESLSSLDASIQAVDTKLTDSIKRQESFEQFVVTRLPTNTDASTMVPADWVKGQDVITKLLFTTDDDPLTRWFDGLAK